MSVLNYFIILEFLFINFAPMFSVFFCWSNPVVFVFFVFVLSNPVFVVFWVFQKQVLWAQPHGVEMFVVVSETGFGTSMLFVVSETVFAMVVGFRNRCLGPQKQVFGVPKRFQSVQDQEFGPNDHGFGSHWAQKQGLGPSGNPRGVQEPFFKFKNSFLGFKHRFLGVQNVFWGGQNR